MYFAKRQNKDGTVTFRFTYLDPETGKRKRLPQSSVPHFDSEAEARAWAKSQQAILSAKRAHIEAKLNWRDQFYNFQELLDLYAKWQQSRAPNSWKSNVYYLEQWVFPYFLLELKSNNVNNWHLHTRQFVDWLQSEEACIKKERPTPLAASTVNNIVKTFNGFLSCLLEYNRLDPDALRKAPTLPEHKLNRRSKSDVIYESEMLRVHHKMQELHQPAAEFFLVLWHTGMRFNELFGLPMSALFLGEVTSKSLADELKKAGISYHGYIYLDSQLEHDDRRRETDRSLKRKPLKSCKGISAKNSRLIPIRTKEVWNILATRHLRMKEAFLRKDYGPNKADYPLFDDLSWNMANLTLKRAYEALKMKPRSYHCCRHSFTTLLVGETRNMFLTRAITGHKKDKSFERYLHIYEEMNQDALENEQEIVVL